MENDIDCYKSEFLTKTGDELVKFIVQEYKKESIIKYLVNYHILERWYRNCSIFQSETDEYFNYNFSHIEHLNLLYVEHINKEILYLIETIKNNKHYILENIKLEFLVCIEQYKNKNSNILQDTENEVIESNNIENEVIESNKKSKSFKLDNIIKHKSTYSHL